MTQQITLIKDKILSDNYFTLHNITYDLTRKDGEVIRHKREVYDRGNGATILLYNAKKKSVVLIRQFRVATWVNGNESGQLIEIHGAIGKRGRIAPESEGNARHGAPGDQGIFFECPGEEGENEIELHFHPQRPQRAV